MIDPQIRDDGAVAVILGSAFSEHPPRGVELTPLLIDTPWGEVEVHRVDLPQLRRPAYLLFRHGLPHQRYPQQINFRAQAVALKKLNCRALLVTSSVGVLDHTLPLDQPLLVSDLLMPDHRLPDGSLCTALTDLPRPLNAHSKLTAPLRPGHLVLQGPLCAPQLDDQVSSIVNECGAQLGPAVTFSYVAGPRTKTAAENRYWLMLGAQVNSMSVGPELILANELEIPTSALVIGHKYSHVEPRTDVKTTLETSSGPHTHNAGHREMSDTLKRSHHALEKIVVTFLSRAQPVEFPHYIFRYST